MKHHYLTSIWLILAVGSASSELSEFTVSSTRFGLEFFKRAFNPAENAVLSPISLHASLSMFYPLAGNKVSPDMERVLHLPSDKAVASENLRTFLQGVNRQQGDRSALKVFSKVYHVDAQLQPEVLPLFRDNFGAEIEPADFEQAEQVVASVNEWVEQASDGLIKNLMEPGDLRVDNDLMLLNVVVLNASWEVPFSPEDTRRVPFHFQNGVHQVDMMTMEGEFLYAHLPDYGCVAVELPYEDWMDLSMVAILPSKRSSLGKLMESLNVELYEAIDERLGKERLDIGLPKFTVKKKTDAQQLLKDMGLKSLFDELDLNLLIRDKSRIGEVRQTVYVQVDERGTVGAAATEVQAVGRSSYPSFFANRPFLYLIRKRSTKDIIFIGHYSVYEQQQNR